MRMKKLFAGIAAAATMLGGLALGASAANADATSPVTGNATFTFTAKTKEQLTTAKLTAYKIGDYYQVGDNAYMVKSNDVNKEAVRKAVNEAVEPDASENEDALAYALQQGLLDQSPDRPWSTGTTRAFANALAKETLQGGATVNFTGEPTEIPSGSGDAVYQASVNLPAGIYLFVDGNTNVEGKVTVAVPMVVASGTVDTRTHVLTDATATATVNMKNTSNGEKTKTVTEQTASIGDTLHYTLSGTVANPAPDSFKFTDKPGTGLTINFPTEDEANGFVVKVDGAESPLKYGTDYTINNTLIDNKGDGAKTFEVVLTESGLKAAAGKTVTVEYTAVVNDEAPGEGDVVNDLDNYGKPVEVSTELSGFRITKTDADGNRLDGAQFQVKDDKSSDPLYFVQQSEGSYKKAASSKTPGATQTVTSALGGVVKLSGLSKGNRYTVTETKAPDGFMQSVLPTFQVEWKLVSADHYEFALTKEDAFKLVTTVPDLGFVVKNVRNVTELPKTGAAGIAMFTVLGLLIAGAAVAVYVKSSSIRRSNMA